MLYSGKKSSPKKKKPVNKSKRKRKKKARRNSAVIMILLSLFGVATIASGVLGIIYNEKEFVVVLVEQIILCAIGGFMLTLGFVVFVLGTVFQSSFSVNVLKIGRRTTLQLVTVFIFPSLVGVVIDVISASLYSGYKLSDRTLTAIDFFFGFHLSTYNIVYKVFSYFVAFPVCIFTYWIDFLRSK